MKVRQTNCGGVPLYKRQTTGQAQLKDIKLCNAIHQRQ